MVDVKARWVEECGATVTPRQATSTRLLETEAFKYCLEVTRRRARNFYYGLKLSPEPQRSALYAIYAWMRAADDIVDDFQGDLADSTHQRLREFRANTDAALAGEPGNHPLWLGLAAASREFSLSPEHFHGMLEGQLDDLSKGVHESFEQLRNYCYRVASTVGLICIEIWGYTHESARDLAIDRGIAFQLTNIVRDYKQDYDCGRIYLPLEDFAEHGIDPKTLREWKKPIACHTMVMRQVQRAAQYYDRSSGLEQLVTPSCRPTLWAMTRIYRGLLDKISRNPANVILARRLRLSAFQKGAIALRARWQVRTARQRRDNVQAVTEA